MAKRFELKPLDDVGKELENAYEKNWNILDVTVGIVDSTWVNERVKEVMDVIVEFIFHFPALRMELEAMQSKMIVRNDE